MKLHKLLQIAFFIGILGMMTSCQQETPRPIADFIIINDNCGAPCTVRFTNTSSTEGDAKYLWRFGEGRPLDTAFVNVQYRYLNPGTYQVSLTAESAGGVSEKTAFVTIGCNAIPGLLSLTLQDYPRFKPSGEPWDRLSCCPDIEMRIIDVDRNVTVITGNAVTNVNMPPVFWSSNSPVSFLGATRIKIQFWDIDNPEPAELMGETNVIALNAPNICRFQNLSLTGEDNIRVALQLQWN